jgi:hypothetical protein
MNYSLRSLMTFSIRDLFWVLTLAAVLTAWWMDRYSSRIELQSVRLRLALEEENNKHLTFRAKVEADARAMMESNLKEHFERDAILRAAADESLKKAIEAYRKMTPPPLPDSSAPTPNPPKP